MSFLNEIIKNFANKNKNTSQGVQINKNIKPVEEKNSNDIVVYAPKNISELNKVIDCIAFGQPIIINLNNIKTAEFNKITDYLCGALYALNADIQCLQNLLYVITPKSIKLSTL